MLDHLAELQSQYQIQEKKINQLQNELASLGPQPKITNDISASQRFQDQAYGNKQDQLSEMLGFQNALRARIKNARIYAQIPHDRLVQVVDQAVPAPRPVGPNKYLNIFLGTVGGAFLGSVLGTIAVLISSWLKYRQQSPGA